MFIYHFHRIIRHRIVWGAFAGGVSLLFLFTGYSYLNNPSKTTVAQVGGKPVSSDTFAAMEQEMRGLGRSRRESIPFPEIATQIWQQVAALQVADELKLGASREEIKSAVRESLGAMDENESAVRVNYLLERLRELKLTTAQYQNYLARFLTLRKVGSVVESAAWVTPVELEDELAGLTDEMQVRVIAVTNRFAGIGATEAQVRAFFDAHTNSFRLPKRVAVEYVAVSVSNYLGRVTVPEEQIKEYYDDHGDKLSTTNASGFPTLAEARPQIVTLLQRANARQAAYTNLTATFLPAVTNRSSFAAAAAAAGLPLRRTALFAQDETPDGIDAGKEFRDAAFDLDPTQPDAYCNAVQGENHVYAIIPLTNSPAHMPTLDEVSDRVRPLAAAKARSEAFRDYLESLHKDLAKGLHESRNLLAVAQSKALNVSTTITFAVHTLYPDAFEDCMPVARAALHLQPGELSEPSATTDKNGAVFVYMVSRRPGDPLSADMLRARARANLERDRAGGLTPGWMVWNLARKGLSLTPHMVQQLAVRTESGASEE